LLTAAAAALLCGSAQAAGSPSEQASVAEQYLLAAANQERAARGLQPLHRDPALAHAAAQHARQMAEHSGISHQFAGEPELTTRGASAGAAFTLIEENVAEAPSAVQIHDLWMHSDHHRENMLNPLIDAAGISVVERGGELYAVEDFAKITRALGYADQEAAIAALLRRQGRIAIETAGTDVTSARETCARDSGYAGARKPWFVMRFTASSLDRLPDELNTRLASGKYHQAVVGACAGDAHSAFTSYNIAVLLYP
jgi:hypothetical protein